MQEHIYKVIEIVGSSQTSIEDAISTAISLAGETLRHLRWFEVLQTRGHVENGKDRTLSSDVEGRLHHGRGGLTRANVRNVIRLSCAPLALVPGPTDDCRYPGEGGYAIEREPAGGEI